MDTIAGTGVTGMNIDDRLHAGGPIPGRVIAQSATPLLIACALAGALAVLLLASAPASPAAAATSQVVTNCNNAGVGSLRQAVLDAPSGATITFAASLSCNSITLTRTIRIIRDLTIDGPGSSSLAVNGNGTVDVFDVAEGTNATIDGLTIEDGGGNYNGGGIYNNGSLTVVESVLSLNSASGIGGGISNVGGVLNVTESTFLDNSAGSLGGAIFNDSESALTVSDSSFIYNNAQAGGGIVNEGAASIDNSTLTVNLASNTNGGGILNYATLEVTDTTMSRNGAVGLGGGIFNAGSASFAGTIVARSPDGHDCSGKITDAGYNLDDDGSCGFSAVHHSLSGVNPELGPAKDNGGPTATESPAMGSEVLDRIPPTARGNHTTLCAGTDQRGVPRPQETDCDMGSVEMECDIATVGTPFSFTVTTFGSPVPSLTEKGTLPQGLEFTDNGNGRGTISGTPIDAGGYQFTIKATFGKSPTDHVIKQAFTLTVDPE
jgi:hypothetical protein